MCRRPWPRRLVASIDTFAGRRYGRVPLAVGGSFFAPERRAMKVLNSLKSAKKRDKNCRIVRRKGRVYVINKSNPRYKARQG